MVSLSRSINTNSGGATFFSDSTTMENQDLQPILQTFGDFKPLNTIPAFSIHLVFTLILEILAIIAAANHPDQNSKCIEYFILIYAQVALWFLTLIIHVIAREKHFQLRLNGYLEFYNETSIHHKLPFFVTSLWSVVIMLIQTIMQHFYPDNFAEKCLQGGILSPIAYLCAFITVEFCVIAGININYIVRVRKFNTQKPPPDVLKEEWVSVGTHEGVHQDEIGYRHLGDKLYDFLEKQADLIRHLKDHNERLSSKVGLLNDEIKILKQRNPNEGPSTSIAS